MPRLCVCMAHARASRARAKTDKLAMEQSMQELADQFAVLEDELELHRSIPLAKRLTTRVGIIGFCIVGVVSIAIYVM